MFDCLTLFEEENDVCFIKSKASNQLEYFIMKRKIYENNNKI